MQTKQKSIFSSIFQHLYSTWHYPTGLRLGKLALFWVKNGDLLTIATIPGILPLLLILMTQVFENRINFCGFRSQAELFYYMRLGEFIRRHIAFGSISFRYNIKMAYCQVFEQSIQIRASATAVESCITDLELMHRWLNPALRCDPVGDWSTELGSRSRFRILVPLWQPTLNSVVVEREPGLIVWEFQGFFTGRDRWECQPEGKGTRLVNRFEFSIPNPIIAFGFDRFAANWTRQDMQAQLRRFKQVAERIYLSSGTV